MSYFLRVRVTHGDLWKVTLGQIAGWGLYRIEMRPPATTPEAELTFGPFEVEGTGPTVVRQLEQRGVSILAQHTREEAPSR